MSPFEGRIISKLPNAGTSIFAVMSKLAAENNAINLSQGFPDFEVSSGLIDMINYYMKAGFNQYAPMTGVPGLRKMIAEKYMQLYGVSYNPETEINITSGATQAIYTAIAAIIREDDEALVFEPAYDSYAPAVKLNGGRVKFSRLKYPDFSINWEEVTSLISHRTKLIIINSPHNPTGSTLRKEDMIRLERVTRNTDIVILSDEVYEHLIYDNREHHSACRFPGLAGRSFIIGSFGKTFHATGWKIGYALAPPNLMAEFRKAHQFIVFTCNTPVQMALAEYMKNQENYLKVGEMYQEKRDYFGENLKKSRFTIIPSYGTYFQLLDYSGISDENDFDFALTLVKEYKLASIPVSPFLSGKNNMKLLRFCFAKKKETLDKAIDILCRI